jgi:hypothetical protein
MRCVLGFVDPPRATARCDCTTQREHTHTHGHIDIHTHTHGHIDIHTHTHTPVVAKLHCRLGLREASVRHVCSWAPVNQSTAKTRQQLFLRAVVCLSVQHSSSHNNAEKRPTRKSKFADVSSSDASQGGISTARRTVIHSSPGSSPSLSSSVR